MWLSRRNEKTGEELVKVKARFEKGVQKPKNIELRFCCVFKPIYSYSKTHFLFYNLGVKHLKKELNFVRFMLNNLSKRLQRNFSKQMLRCVFFAS